LPRLPGRQRQPVDFLPRILQRALVKSLLLILVACSLVLAPAAAAEKKRYILYATVIADTPVDLEDGSRWMMDKGDSFPLLMFKEQQTKVVLQLAGTSFWIDADRVRILDQKQVTDEVIASYRRNVQTYIDGTSEKIQKALRESARR
jgi:hypothetical protein